MTMIGVLGGMGPAATVDFMAKLVSLTPATCDQDHLPVLVASLPQVPDRSRAILAAGPLALHEDPLPALCRGLRLLNGAGVGVIAMPCHTAHHWYGALASRSAAPLLHIGRAALEALPPVRGLAVGLLATRGTLHAGFYQRMLAERGMKALLPDAQRTQPAVDACIAAVKAGRAEQGARHLHQALAAIARDGAQVCLLACTELPVAAALMTGEAAVPCVDPTLELARAAVAYARSHGGGSGSVLSGPRSSTSFHPTGVSDVHQA